MAELTECFFDMKQALEGVPVVKVEHKNYATYFPLTAPSKMVKVSENESYAIFDGPAKSVKITVTTEGTGNERHSPVVTVEEVAQNV